MQQAEPILPENLRALGVAAAFSTRSGGVSTGIFSSLNFGNPSDLPHERRDPASNIGRNLEVLLACAGVERRNEKEIVQVHQVHGAAAHVVRAEAASHAGPTDTKADAIVTDDPSRVLCIRTADCTPVLLSSADGRVVGAVHAGWRGVIAGVAAETVRAMRLLGAEEITGAIGPCISLEHFEVGPEVVAEFRRVFGAAAPCNVVNPSSTDSKGFIDLQAALHMQLETAGVRGIETCRLCTVARPDLFFSHRRENGRTGRMAAIIAAKGG